MSTYKITTLGCKVNHSESDAIAHQLRQQGLEPHSGQGSCDICVINTCTVTQKGAMQSRQEIRKLIRQNPKARIIVTGCYAQIGKEELRKIEGIHEIIDNFNKLTIANRISPVASQTACVMGQFPEDIHPQRTRPFLKIQDGCNTFCSYCIVPLARGRSVSMDFDKVLANIRHFKRNGFLEVVLTGIHIGSYGLDLNPQRSLLELFEQIKNTNPIDRIRLSSIEPLELNKTIIATIIKHDIFCDHFHIPLQSGDDEILKKMKRPYTANLFTDKIQSINRKSPEAAIGVDVLVGFPGETDRSFEITYALLESLPLAYFHVFPFSARQGTKAYSFPNKVPTDIIKARCSRLRKLGKTKKLLFLGNALGKSKRVLIEGKRDSQTGNLKGLTSNYIQVHLPGDDVLMNQLVEIKLERLNEKRFVLEGSL